jgi:phage gp36-like protein
MAYCTQAQLETRYGQAILVQLCDRDEEPTGMIDAAFIARCIADASARIDGYVAARHDLPLSEAPPLLTGICERLAIYIAHGDAAPDKITKDYEAAMRELRDISSGALRLPLASGQESAQAQGTIETNEPERPFSADTMKGFI